MFVGYAIIVDNLLKFSFFQRDARIDFNKKLNNSRQQHLGNQSTYFQSKLKSEESERAVKIFTLNTYFSPKYKSFDRQISSSVIMTVSADDAKFIENITRDQHENWIREGRVTGTLLCT